jgi:hypothetical protein
MQRSRQKVQLNVEEMEGRTVPSSTPLFVSQDLPANLVSHLGQRLHLFIPQPTQFQLNPALLARLAHGLHLSVPDLAGVRFRLDSLSNPGTPAHELDIQTLSYNADGSASFTGTWSPLGDPANAKQVFNARLAYDALGIHITFNFGPHSFDGHITRQWLFWHIDGTTDAAPGHVAGNQIISFPWLTGLANLGNQTLAR